MNTLVDTKSGDHVRITDVTSDTYTAQLLRLGIHTGTEVECILKLPRGPIVVGLGGMQLALGRDLAQAITVDRINA